jgi:xanthine dehydrogenase accessory factor
MAIFDRALTLIRGAGDLASGVAYRLHRAGLPIVMTELPFPLAVRTAVSFSSAVRYDVVVIEGIYARRHSLDHLDALYASLSAGEIPVLVDPDGFARHALRPLIVVDARIAKRNIDTTPDDAPLVIGLGPGFAAGMDCHAVIETNRGHFLGRAWWEGTAEPDTGVPANVNGREAERVLRAPSDGHMLAYGTSIGCPVRAGTLIAHVGGVPVIAPFDGVLRGLIDDDTWVARGTKIGDLDPRTRRQHCFTISDKSLAVGGGVLEAILAAPQVRAALDLDSSEGTTHAISDDRHEG